MKIGVIGAGSIGRRHIKGFAGLRAESGVGAITVFDPNPERAAEAAGLGADIVACKTLAEAVSGVDAVCVCAPTSLHTRVMGELLDLGAFHIFMEKPLASEATGWAELIERHERTGKRFIVGYMLRKHPVLRRLKSIVEGGTLGRVLHARAESGFYLPYWHPHEDYRDFYMSYRTGGGGALLDTSHEIDYLTWLLGSVAEVQATVETVSDLEISSDDLVQLTFRLKSGIRAQVHLDLLQFDEARHCKVVGTKGVVSADLAGQKVSTWHEGDKAWTVEKVDVSWDAIYGEEYRDFLSVCQGEDRLLPTAREALNVMEIIEAARRSHASGGTVRLPLWDL